MFDPTRQLYDSSIYPAMSHPLSDPAVTAVAARMAGLKSPDPARARILEIGCCSGHNLLPLAMRWPESQFVGIDLAEHAILKARERASAAGIENALFLAGDLRDFSNHTGPFDYIIAHGFLSWVPDEAKAALFAFCRENLTRSGIATISFNLECGWRSRFPVIQKARAIQQAGAGDIISSLEILRTITEPESQEWLIIEDMIAKGPWILPFDDFSPVNDPWSLDQFVTTASAAGLRWLGESDPAQNFPANLGDDDIGRLAIVTDDAVALQTAADEVAGRMFRSAVICREDAPVLGEIPFDVVREFSYRAGTARAGQPEEVWQAISAWGPACLPYDQLAAALPCWDDRQLASVLFEEIMRGSVLARSEQVLFEASSPDFPRLDSFRLKCAKERLPLVDVWHKPCLFPERHYDVLMEMDGTRGRGELAALSANRCPELAFGPWLRHLASRGMFS
jgi:SAM-dependent methyltransferase